MRYLSPLVLRFVALSGVLSTLWSCSGAQSEPMTSPSLATERADASIAAPPVENVHAPVTHLERREVVEVIDQGMGRFLQTVSVAESLNDRGEFQGFRIVRFEERKYFEGLGIGPGDVVTRINDLPIERPAEAYAAFIGLKTAPRLDIDYLRGGRPMRLSLPIVGAPAKGKPQAAQRPSGSEVTVQSASNPKESPPEAEGSSHAGESKVPAEKK